MLMFTVHLSEWIESVHVMFQFMPHCLTSPGQIADFGLAAECTTDLQGVVGTLPYMAPQAGLWKP